MSGPVINRRLPVLVEALQKNASFPHPVDHTEIVETHISFILLTGSYAYKILKPVNLGFLDFSTLEKRKHCCEEALRLNRRHASDIYIDMVTISGDENAPVINGKGPVLEYAVRMVQFDRSMELDKLVIKKELSPALMDKLAVAIASFHEKADVAGPKSGMGTLPHILHPVMENYAQIRTCLQDDEQYNTRLMTLKQWSVDEFKKLEPLFNTRKSKGFIRECHGDMHLRNIVLINATPVIFDCIEFSEELRWIDVLNDFSFLIMDLDEHDCSELSQRLLNTYLEYTGDYSGLDVLRFYLVYRALVRAKVACIRLGQKGKDEATRADYRRYIDLALAFTQKPAPVLFITCGLSGSGKTWMSQSLLEKWGAIRIRSDVERKRLQDLAATEKTGSSIGGGIYSTTITQDTYQRLNHLTIDVLNAGYSVIADATFQQSTFRRDFIELASARHVPIVILYCHASDNTLRQRVKSRSEQGKDASEADINVLEYQLKNFQALSENEQQYCIEIDTEDTLDMDAILNKIKNKLALGGSTASEPF